MSLDEAHLCPGQGRNFKKWRVPIFVSFRSSASRFERAAPKVRESRHSGTDVRCGEGFPLLARGGYGEVSYRGKL